MSKNYLILSTIIFITLTQTSLKTSAPALDLSLIHSVKGSSSAQEPLSPRSKHMAKVWRDFIDPYLIYRADYAMQALKAKQNIYSVISEIDTKAYPHLIHAYSLLFKDLYPNHPSLKSPELLQKQFEKQTKLCLNKWFEEIRKDL